MPGKDELEAPVGDDQISEAFGGRLKRYIVIDERSGVRGGVQKEGAGTGAPLNTPQSPLTSE